MLIGSLIGKLPIKNVNFYFWIVSVQMHVGRAVKGNINTSGNSFAQVPKIGQSIYITIGLLID